MDRLVEASVNASLPRRISADQLATCLRGADALEPWLAHVQAFFTEVPIGAVESFAAAHGISMAALRDAYRRVKAVTGDESPDVDAWFGYLEEPALQGTDRP